MTRLYACVLVLGIVRPSFADDLAPPALTAASTGTVVVSHVTLPVAATSSLFAAPPLKGTAPTTGVLSTPRLALAAQGVARGGTDRPHKFGLGGKAGGFTFGVGASARLWPSERIGFQVDLSHYGISSVSILQVAPSVLFVLGDPDLDKATQIRPYAGGGVSFFRTALSSFGSDTGIGGQGFVGTELVFGGAPRFGLSGDLGYYSTGDFFGITLGGFAMSVAGHYYIR